MNVIGHADLAIHAAALQREVQALRQDAERYRWLRDTKLTGYQWALLLQTIVKHSQAGIDAAVDAAMAQTHNVEVSGPREAA